LLSPYWYVFVGIRMSLLRSGDFKGHVFRQNYRFLDEHRQTEMTQLNQALRKAKDESERIKYQRVLDKYVGVICASV